MRVLVTGADGFVGRHLVEMLRSEDHAVVATSRTGSDSAHEVDVRDRKAVNEIIEAEKPEVLFHLAAQSSAALSWKEPSLTYDVNVGGTHVVLEATRDLAPDCKVLISATSDAYGRVSPDLLPVDESVALNPVSPYATSKVAQEEVARFFHRAFGVHVVITRAFMHTGPGQPSSFATAEWARQIALAELQEKDVELLVGDITLRREFGDVRDVVRAYRDAVDWGSPGDVYNVATGDARRLEDVLGILTSSSTVAVSARTDPHKLRPADPPALSGDASKLHEMTGWKPEFTLEETVKDVLDYWRKQVGVSGPAS